MCIPTAAETGAQGTLRLWSLSLDWIPLCEFICSLDIHRYCLGTTGDTNPVWHKHTLLWKPRPHEKDLRTKESDIMESYNLMEKILIYWTF